MTLYKEYLVNGFKYTLEKYGKDLFIWNWKKNAHTLKKSPERYESWQNQKNKLKNKRAE